MFMEGLWERVFLVSGPEYCTIGSVVQQLSWGTDENVLLSEAVSIQTALFQRDSLISDKFQSMKPKQGAKSRV